MLQDKILASCSDCVACNHKHPLFGLLNEEELSTVNTKRFEVSFSAGEMLFKQGAPASHLVCVTSGLVKIYMEGPNDKNLIFKIAKATELFGGPGTFVDSRHHYSAKALIKTTACFIEVDAFRHLLRTNVPFNEAFLIGISKNAMFMHERFYTNAYKQMHGRLAEALIYLSKKVYQENPFSMHLNRVDLAELTGLSRESVIRILKEFKKEDIYEEDSKGKVHLDLAALERISQFN